jgi:Leucine-rich repeat (LRR) protein
VEQLILDECHFKQFSPQLKSELEKYKNLIYLSLNDCQLKSLDNFPNLPNLVKLDLLDNNLSGESLSKIASQQSLQQLALGGNPIKTLEEVKVLSKLRELKEVDFIQCPVSELPDYREKVYELIDGLDILDNCDRDGNQVADDDEVILFIRRTKTKTMKLTTMTMMKKRMVLFIYSEYEEEDEDEEDEDSEE